MAIGVGILAWQLCGAYAERPAPQPTQDERLKALTTHANELRAKRMRQAQLN
jgi:hypothetical protein